MGEYVDLIIVMHISWSLIIQWHQAHTHSCSNWDYKKDDVRFVSMQFSHIIEQSPCNWETTMNQNVVLKIFHRQQKNIYLCGKLSELHYNALLVSNHGEKVMKWRKKLGQIGPIAFIAVKTFSLGLENNETSKCGSESFPRLRTYILCVENCQTHILTNSCLPMAGRLFYNVRKFRDPESESATCPQKVNNLPSIFKPWLS